MDDPPRPPAVAPRVVSAVQRRGMRDAVLGMAFGALGILAITGGSNGPILVYLAECRFSDSGILLLLSLPAVIQTLCLLPAAFVADRRGKKAMVVTGSVLAAAAFVVIALSTCFTDLWWARLMMVLGIGLMAIGQALLSAPWFAMLSPLVPEWMRGFFFGAMRLTWQTGGFLFGIACAWAMAALPAPASYQCIFLAILLGLLVRIVYMARVPELEQPSPGGLGLVPAIAVIARTPGYASFCSYAFLITLVTSSVPNLFALVEKNSLGFSGSTIVWMGNLYMIGSVAGFPLGGWLCDRFGTKWMFLLCHLGFATVLFMFLTRGLGLLPPAWFAGLLNAAFGLASAASSIAISTEMLALIPPQDKSLSTALCNTLLVAGTAIAGVLIAGALRIHLFSASWTIFGATLGPEDAILLLCGILVLILVVTLGLVPSVLRARGEHQIPR